MTLDSISIRDERAFRRVAVYADLKRILLRTRYPFLVLRGRHASPDMDNVVLRTH